MPLCPECSATKFGSFELTSLFDGYGTRPLDDKFIVNAPVDQVRAAARDAFRPTDTLKLSYTPTVVHTGTSVVLLDSGTGGKLGATTGMMSRGLDAAGIPPSAITAIVISHFHPDHISGIKAADNTLAFPNAEILVPETEYAYWMDEGEASRAPAGRKSNFELARATFSDLGSRLRRYRADEEVIPGMTAVAAYGIRPAIRRSAFRLTVRRRWLWATSATSRSCSSAIRIGRQSSIWTPTWRGQLAASCWTRWRLTGHWRSVTIGACPTQDISGRPVQGSISNRWPMCKRCEAGQDKQG